MFRRARTRRIATYAAAAGDASPVALVAAAWPMQSHGHSPYPGRAARIHLMGSAEPTGPVRTGVLSREEAVSHLVWAAESRDDETSRHIDQMSRYCELLAIRAGLGPERAGMIRRATRLHDIGKVCIPRNILLKPERLTAAEFEIVQRHTEIGHRILAGSGVEWLEMAAVVALTHHEHYDGCGYPNHLSGSEIPFVGRIAAIADVFDALTSRRPYKSALPTERAVDIMLEGRGKQFDPSALDLFLRSLDEVLDIRDEAADRLVRSPRGTLVSARG
ncbi:MAG: HD-GYP domain-containing protein [Actinomycetota bacterium]